MTCNGARGRAIRSIQNNTPEKTRVIPVTLLRRRLARYRSVIRNLQVTSWYGSRQRFPAQGSSLSYIGNTAIAGMRLVGRGKKGTNAVRPRKPRDRYSTEIFAPPGRIGRDRTHIAVRVCRERNAAVASSPISEPGTSPQGRRSLWPPTNRAAARNSRTPFGRSDAARRRRR